MRHYPDLLKDVKDGKVIIRSNQWSSLWIDVKLTDEIPAGDYEIEIQLVKEESVICSAKRKITVIGVHLPKQKIMHTEWFHADCLADYYHVDVFSDEPREEHLETFKAAKESLGNMLDGFHTFDALSSYVDILLYRTVL